MDAAAFKLVAIVSWLYLLTYVLLGVMFVSNVNILQGYFLSLTSFMKFCVLKYHRLFMSCHIVRVS